MEGAGIALFSGRAHPEMAAAIAATHGLFVGHARQHLASFPLSRIILTDSIARKELGSLPVHIVSLKKPLAGAIRKLIFTPES
jgi:phosphoribosylpyrophosphate synthetase